MTDTIALVVHPRREDAWEMAGFSADWLRAAGLRVFFPQRGETAAACRLVLTFGGDGTLLTGAKTALEYDCPLLGVNMGTMGFLTEGDPTRMDEILQAVLREKYETESRGLLRVWVNGEKAGFDALNDAVVTRGGFARLIQVETRVNGEHWSTFTADGVMAATPTGSTGYSLSAGGPVVAPGVDCMIITPVCAHSLQHCPCVVPAGAEVVFHLREDRDQNAELQIDGQNLRTLRAGDSVRVTGAEKSLRLVRLSEPRFFTVLQTKLNEWSTYEGARSQGGKR